MEQEVRSHLHELAAQLPSGWRLMFWSDAAAEFFIGSQLKSEFLRAFLSIEPKYGPARADFLRYAIMDKCGGVWLDLKSWWEKPDHHLRKFAPLPPLVFCNWGFQNQDIAEDTFKRGEIQNWNLVSAPGHPIWGCVLEAVRDEIMRELSAQENPRYVPKKGKQEVLRITGPILLSRIAYPMLAQYPHLLLKNNSDFGFMYDRWAAQNRGSHVKLNQRAGLGKHYTKLKDPIIRPAGQIKRGSVLMAAHSNTSPYEVPRAVARGT